MNQMTTFILMFCGISILFYIFGVGTGTNPLLDLLLSPQTMSIGDFWSSVLAFTVFAAGGLTLGLVYKNLELGVMTAVLPLVASALWEFTKVVSIVYSVSPIFAVLILGPVIFLFILSLIEYWRGRD